ncbi:MAG: hypothetical protein A2566_03455 [Candidatus Zambryskibacteria bacterium RIFOXYD1_FULL_40_13]|nr:MAG: hypothetical protein A2123_02950 [Candidatus Zambryskibacteria bacterium GWB1_40_5]OHB15512.1 MAG: hypothetical protein A2566_03455 [Candidatus Zambryskibacteria bacterium RIFOXYD1_FULL_40_13]HBD24582.1 hypothetical protein [Candidatus Zambryskibacteria bacterium]HBO17453.1 hypothetical protein [Candidatus Zambryskibacteria bacterium]HBZ04250.1 hypothetical protein [Candidatus Zambryskibacteria bacterium]
MDQKEFNKAHEEALQKQMLEEPYDWSKPRRHRWDEWGSPVGLALGWAIVLVSTGFFLYLLHLAGLLG